MVTTVGFDLGGVLIDWDPRHLYRKLFADAEEMETFLGRICTQEWNVRQDAGRPIADALAERVALFPEHAHLIRAFYDRWEEMLAGAHQETVEILRTLKDDGRPLYALTNWSAETFPRALERFDFLHWFDAIVVSGEEKIAKPDPAIYRLLLERHELDAADCVFIDDSERNVQGARAVGMHGVRFTSPETLRRNLARLSLL